MSLWERFDDIVKPEEVAEAKAQFSPLEEGRYECILEELVAAESKSGLPMLKGKFRTAENRILFYNQVLQNVNYPNLTAKNVALANDFVNGVRNEEVTFTSLGELAGRVESCPMNGRFIVEVSYGDKDYEKKFAQLEIVENLTEDSGFEVTDDDIPF